jgi:hypothetical protein
MHTRRRAITVHAAYILAAKLRRANVHATGRDVLTWSHRTIAAARLWLDTIAPHAGRSTWADFMGADLPPPSHQPWLQNSARTRGLDGAGW